MADKKILEQEILFKQFTPWHESILKLLSETTLNSLSWLTNCFVFQVLKLSFVETVTNGVVDVVIGAFCCWLWRLLWRFFEALALT